MKVTLLAAAATVVLATAALPAQARADDARIQLWEGPDHDYYRDTYRIGYERGYRDGAEHGEDDADDHKGFDFAHDKKYRCGSGYKRHYGPQEAYLAGYRRGYEVGYRRAYAAWSHDGRGGYGYFRDDDRDRYYRDRYGRDDDRDERDRWDDDDDDDDDGIIYEEPRWYRR